MKPGDLKRRIYVRGHGTGRRDDRVGEKRNGR
jgi:hypothetical protein